MNDVKLRDALIVAYMAGSSHGHEATVEGYWSECDELAKEYADEAIAQPAEAVDLTDEECLIVMHAATSKVLPEDEHVPLEDILSSYRLKLRGASALLSGLRAVIAAHEAKRSQS